MQTKKFEFHSLRHSQAENSSHKILELTFRSEGAQNQGQVLGEGPLLPMLGFVPALVCTWHRVVIQLVC